MRVDVRVCVEGVWRGYEGGMWCKESVCTKRREEGGWRRRESNEGERGNSKGPLSTTTERSASLPTQTAGHPLQTRETVSRSSTSFSSLLAKNLSNSTWYSHPTVVPHSLVPHSLNTRGTASITLCDTTCDITRHVKKPHHKSSIKKHR